MGNNTESYYKEINSALDIMNDTIDNYDKVIRTESDNLDIEIYKPKSNYENKIEKYKNYTQMISETSTSLSTAFSNISSGIVGIMQASTAHKEKLLQFKYDIKKIDFQIKELDNNLTKELQKEHNKFEIIKSQLDIINKYCSGLLELMLKIDSATCSDKQFEEKQDAINKINDIIGKSCDMIIQYFMR
ncbi:MAG: hypothetical protein ACYCSW_11255 [bacterium]